jgi:hypothetical protein
MVTHHSVRLPVPNPLLDDVGDALLLSSDDENDEPAAVVAAQRQRVSQAHAMHSALKRGSGAPIPNASHGNGAVVATIDKLYSTEGHAMVSLEQA